MSYLFSIYIYYIRIYILHMYLLLLLFDIENVYYLLLVHVFVTAFLRITCWYYHYRYWHIDFLFIIIIIITMYDCFYIISLKNNFRNILNSIFYIKKIFSVGRWYAVFVFYLWFTDVCVLLVQNSSLSRNLMQPISK